MKISINSDIVSYDSNILKAQYTKIFESGIKGNDKQTISIQCSKQEAASGLPSDNGGID